MMFSSMIQRLGVAAVDAGSLATPPLTEPVGTSEVVLAPHHWWAGFILYLPLISLILCGVCAAMKVKTKLPAWITAGCLLGSFVFSLLLYFDYGGSPELIPILSWINLSDAGGNFSGFAANFTFYIDSLSLLWIMFVTGLGTLITIYASEYMETDLGKGYTRFFAGVSVFLFAMVALVLADNLLMLYLGWEGVGFASYWLIGYYYQRPAAVAAAKKAFIMNRIGDLGLALAIYLIWTTFGTIQYDELMDVIRSGSWKEAYDGWAVDCIPWFLMLAAFGKSAQIPLYVWLPDAMEGPTPVSALIHAATMVTAGIYLVARTYEFFLLSPESLHVVAWIGGLTALLAATIGLAQYDIKRIMAYSTVSQLGFMFLGLGVLSTYGAAYHVFTHAFFKAVLFLTCGAIMHGFAGQLDLRKLSGLIRIPGWRITSIAMLIGCLALAGFPFTSGYFSKDAILAEAFITQGPGFEALGWIAIFTAFLTAYYTFRVWFRVCAGKVEYEPGDEHHGDDDHGHHGGGFHPHAPRFAMNFVMAVIAIGALLAAVPYFMDTKADEALAGGWVADMVHDSTAQGGLPGLDRHGQSLGQAVEHAHGDHAHPTMFGMDVHKAMYVVSGVVGGVGLLLAAWLHLFRRQDADRLKAFLHRHWWLGWLPRAMERKWYVDEIYHALVRAPLWIASHLMYAFDRFLIDGLLVDGIARIPRMVAKWFQPLHNGIVQSYAVTMAGGVALIALLMILFLQFWEIGGGG
ncbi:MAG: NADH-quinone oxidoreductase subunit L [Phycisphaerae bacterium]|nr:NADH-quinone oxidoreductase subunit L [Phycisphaerae bacterium]|tara:strand:- start:766 stop:2994 length:2229 start_codon:yes stop_codon:yes gene_type:complete